MTELAIRENLPDHSGVFDTGGRLDDLMWVSLMDWNAYRLRVDGIIKPDLSLKTVPELRKQLTDSYHQIVTILEEAGAKFWEYPALTLKGHVDQGPPPDVYGMEATIRIEIAANWTCC